DQRRPVREEPSISQQRLSELKIQRRRDRRIEKDERVIGEVIVAAETRLDVCARLEGLGVVELCDLRRIVYRDRSAAGSLQCTGRRKGRAIYVVRASEKGSDRRGRAEQCKLRELHLRLLNSHQAVVLKREHDRVAQAQPELSIDNV